MLIILDLDGTIINSEIAHFNSFVKAISRDGFKLSSLQKKKIKNMFGLSVKEIIKGVLPDISDEKVRTISDDVKNISISEEFHNVKFIKGAKKFLADNYRKHDLAIATNSSKAFTFKALKGLKIENFFKKVVTASDVKNAKPDSEMIDLIIKELGHTKKDSALIGDSIFDYLSAKNAKIRFIAVLSKSNYKKELKINAESFSDLSKVKI
jgi:phosphoglycolate phosphatase-like HAD superfamily hydrolase